MNMIQTLPKKHITKGKIFAGGMAAGLLSLGMGGAVGASAYDYGGNYGSDNSNSSSSSATYEQSSSYSETEKSSSRMSCSYSAEWRYDSSSRNYQWMSYDSSSGVWYSCETESSYEHSVQASNYVMANYNNNADSSSSMYGGRYD